MPRKCIEPNCEKVPIYNYPEEKSRIYCSAHARDGMRAVGQQYCQESGCEKYATYNYDGQTTKLYCRPHAKPGMINVKRKPCRRDGCNIQPYYNYPGKTVGLYCTSHRLEGMINVYTKTCEAEGCEIGCSYNTPGEKYGRFCKIHAEPGMINVRSIICNVESCSKQASFAREGCSTPVRCATHKESEMINLRKRTCKINGCKISASYGNGNKEYCAEHREVGMKDMHSKMCEGKGCETTAGFGYTTPTHCSEHKRSDMKNFRQGYGCNYDGCNTCASFNYAGLRPIFCSKHRSAGMFNVKRKFCTKRGCNGYAVFGYPGGPPEFCTAHLQAGTKRLPRKRCSAKNCNELALYGKGMALRCEDHAESDDLNLVERECRSCQLVSICDKDGVCKLCNPTAWKIIRLAKQTGVEKMFRAKGLEFVSTDVTVNAGECGRERPDFLFEAASHCVVVEVDENQHKSRACECEQTRMVNISQSLGLPTIFLRYNPDRYKVKGETRDVLQTSRHKTLRDWVIKLLTLDPEELQSHGFLSVIHLYFDEYNPRKVMWETMIEFGE